MLKNIIKNVIQKFKKDSLKIDSNFELADVPEYTDLADNLITFCSDAAVEFEYVRNEIINAFGTIFDSLDVDNDNRKFIETDCYFSTRYGIHHDIYVKICDKDDVNLLTFKFTRKFKANDKEKHLDPSIGTWAMFEEKSSTLQYLSPDNFRQELITTLKNVPEIWLWLLVCHKCIK